MDGMKDKPGGSKAITIKVNGRSKPYDGKEISFETVVSLADNLPTGDNLIYEVSWRKAQGEANGFLKPGESIHVQDGMKFIVSATVQS